MWGQARSASACFGLAMAVVLSGCISTVSQEDLRPSVRYYAAVADYIQVKNLAVIHAEAPTTSVNQIKAIQKSLDEADRQLEIIEKLRQTNTVTDRNYIATASLLRSITAALREQVIQGE